jgi:hypothetical protein
VVGRAEGPRPAPGTKDVEFEKRLGFCSREGRAQGSRKDLLSSSEREEVKALRGEVRELRRANDILKSASHTSSLAHTFFYPWLTARTNVG